MAKASNGAKPPTNQKKQNWFMALALWKKIAIIFVIVAVAAVVIANLATNPSAKTSDDFLNSIQSGDSDTAYALLSAGAKTTITSDEFAQVVKQIGPTLNTKEATISKSVSAETGTQSSAQVVYEIKGTDGVTYSFTTNLVQENGKWKILNFDSKQK